MRHTDKPIPSHLNDFLDWLDVEKGLSSKSQENYGRFLKKFFVWLQINNLQNLCPHEFDSEHVWKYKIFLARQQKSQKPLKKTTQNYYLIALRALLNYFADRDIIALPAEKIKLARDKDARPVRFLTVEQLEKLFSTPNISTRQGLRDQAILWTLFSTATRIAELVALNRDQLQLNPGIKDIELGIVGKGSRVRTVYFSERALQAIRDYLITRTDDDKALFINYRAKKGSPLRLTARSIEKLIKRYALMAGLPPNTTPHVMRHSFATDLLSQGVDIRTIQEFLGHKNIAATQIYTHVTSKKLREIHRKLHNNERFEK